MLKIEQEFITNPTLWKCVTKPPMQPFRKIFFKKLNHLVDLTGIGH